MRTNAIAYIMSSPQRRKIVRTLFKYSGRLWSCSDVEHLAKTPHATTYRTLFQLRDLDILKSLKVSKKNIIFKEAKSPLVDELKKLAFLEQKIAKKIAKEFVSAIKSEKVESVYLYGSTVTGNLHSHSDIDLLIIIGKHDKRKEKRIQEKASEISYERNKAISTLFMDKEEVKKERETQFIKSVKENMELLYGKESL